MNSFRSEINLIKSEIQIDYSTSVFLLGSCFAHNIGYKLVNSGYNTLINPFGVLYNPLSVLNSLDILFSEKLYTENDLEFYNNTWLSFDHYTGFSHKNKIECLKRINEELIKARFFLNGLNLLVITFGTSWVYEYKKNNKIVSNCHKIPSQQFIRKFITSEEITKKYIDYINKLKSEKPDLKILFTVSPIRHWKDGASANQLSKANLIIAVHKIVEEINGSEYFPSYEIMMDDLRDYRFYKDDMLHPSDRAVEYIWEKFMNTYIIDKAKPIMKKVDKINRAANHIPVDKTSDDYKSFIEKNIEEAELLQKKHGIKLNDTIMNLRSKII